MQSVTPHSRFIYFILFTISAASATRRAGQGGGRAELLRAHPELSWDCQPRSLTGKLAIYVPDYGLYCSRHHTAHLSVFKKALVIAVNPKPSSLSPQGRRRLSAVPPCPPPQALRGARVEQGGGTALPRPGRKAAPAASRHFSSAGAEAFWSRAQGGPAAGRERTPRTERRAPSSARGRTPAPAGSATSPQPPPLSHLHPGHAQPHTPGQEVTLRLSPAMRIGGGGCRRGAGIPPPSPPAAPAPRH